MHSAAFRALGLDAVYVALRVPRAEDLPGLLRGLARAGGGGNITLPHKEAAAALVEVPSPRVVRTGACNTFWMEEGEVHGENTDVEGLSRAVERLLGAPPRGLRILLLGAGGAARAAAVALLEGGAAEVAMWNRNPSRARALAALLDDPRAVLLEEGPASFSADLVVNATSLGLAATDPLPLDPIPGSVGALLDLVYRPEGPTPLVARALDRGIPALDGREMLLQQGMAAFRRWWGREPPEPVMRRVLEFRGEGKP